ncbi:alpha-amylase [Cytobacillus depressus]|uniref:alpha-amylase n=1 Tax=Cytobacillus depressus TaxID=1602942 RepID=A0A6L3V755_9BACI|nr:alpha-amylase family glycosyl hydrolase [Cytobacillus depressus]KAB2337176.1 alpha-amylase [Cytobacillus depressus]
MVNRVWAFILIPLLLFYAHPVGAVEKEDRKWQDESIYYLMVDRFYNGDFKNDFHVNVKDPQSFHGGDFKGIVDKLDYISDMGFTAIWLTPIFDNEEKGYHGYWVKDFYNTEEHFGTIDEYKTLVAEAHNRNMKVILSFPINQYNHEVNDHLIDAAKWWISETKVDGYFLAEVNSASKDFLTDFVQEVKSVKNDFYILGEVRSNDPHFITEYEDTGIDGFIDFPLMESLRPAYAQVDQSLNELITRKEELLSTYKDPYLMGTLMDDDKIERFTRDVITKNQHPGPRWKLAFTYLYTTPGIPIVYYGSEIALDGGLGPDSHRMMDFRTDKDLIDYMTKLGELRNSLPSLTRGDVKVLAEENGVIAYKRTYEGETTVIVINNSSESQSITISASELADNKELRGLLTNDLVKSNDQQYQLFIDREEAEIYVLAPKSGINIPYVAATVIVWSAFIGFVIALWRRSKRNRPQP